MAYNAHEWKTGDTITADLLNALEGGVANEQVGPKGDKGDKGDTGAVGPKGDKGDTGAAGAKGADGSNGADGKSVKAIALTADGDGKITGGTVTLSDDSKLTITVTTA